jgi:hypothetical protein
MYNDIPYVILKLRSVSLQQYILYDSRTYERLVQGVQNLWHFLLLFYFSERNPTLQTHVWLLSRPAFKHQRSPMISKREQQRTLHNTLRLKQTKQTSNTNQRSSTNIIFRRGLRLWYIVFWAKINATLGYTFWNNIVDT